MTPLTSQVTPIQSPRGGAPVSAPDPPPGVARNAGAVGQNAKQIVAEARVSGVDLPKNAQGLAASAVARGVDLESLFAAQVAELPASDPNDLNVEQSLPKPEGCLLYTSDAADE